MSMLPLKGSVRNYLVRFLKAYICFDFFLCFLALGCLSAQTHKTTCIFFLTFAACSFFICTDSGNALHFLLKVCLLLLLHRLRKRLTFSSLSLPLASSAQTQETPYIFFFKFAACFFCTDSGNALHFCLLFLHPRK